MDSWKHHHPDWQYRLWRDADLQDFLPRMGTSAAFTQKQNPALLSDLLRVELIHSFGGLYVDCDFECLQPFLDWGLRAGCFHYGDQAQGCPGNAFLAAPPQHPFVSVLRHKLVRSTTGLVLDGVDGVRDRVYRLTGPGCLLRSLSYYVEDWSGPESMTHPATGSIFANYYAPDVVAFVVESLHPYFYTEVWNPASHPQALGVHHWAGSWFSS
jgi:hypothetical protein